MARTPRLTKISRSRWEAAPWRSTSGRAAPRPPFSARPFLTPSRSRPTPGRSPLSSRLRPSRCPAMLPSALAYARPAALTELVAGIMPAATPASAGPLLVSAAGAAPRASALKAAVAWGVARLSGRNDRFGRGRDQALQTLLDDPATTAAALPIVAKWDKAGRSAPAPSGTDACSSPSSSDARRATIAARRRSPRASSSVPQRRAKALAAIATMLADPAGRDPLKATLLATLNGESAGSDVDAVMVTAFARRARRSLRSDSAAS